MKTPEELAVDYALKNLQTRILDSIGREEARLGFLAGYEAAQQELSSTSAPLNNWISVKDRLPNNDEQVLVFGRGTHELNNRVQPAIRNRCTAEGWAGYDIIDWGGETDDVVNVTHWMPLPKPPNEE